MFNTIKSSKEISELFNNGNFRPLKFFNLIYRNSEFTRVAFIAGKRLGKAHYRNYLKRRLRSLYSENFKYFENKEVLLIAKKDLKECSDEDLKNSLYKRNVFKENN